MQGNFKISFWKDFLFSYFSLDTPVRAEEQKRTSMFPILLENPLLTERMVDNVWIVLANSFTRSLALPLEFDLGKQFSSWLKYHTKGPGGPYYICVLSPKHVLIMYICIIKSDFALFTPVIVLDR